MGCDIHCFVEKKIDGKWEQISGFKNAYYNEDIECFKTDAFKYATSPVEHRNYSMFAILAGVRNRKEHPVKPISEPKGLPTDISDDVDAELAIWEGERHSCSWLTIKEISNYNGNKEGAKYLFGEALEQLKERCNNKNLKDVRIIFCFDN